MNKLNSTNMTVQIATPYCTGSGCILPSHGLIVTNEHVVRDNQRVIVKLSNGQKQLLEVVYLDVRYDLAFIDARELEFDVHLDWTDEVKKGMEIWTMGYTIHGELMRYGGMVVDSNEMINHIPYIRHSARLTPGVSGGPLLDEKGHLAGINCFIQSSEIDDSYALPNQLIQECLRPFEDEKMRLKALRCSSCAHVVIEREDQVRHCPICADPITFLGQIAKFEPSGMPRTIEGLLWDLGHDPQLARHGKNQWRLQRGSALITISYHEKSGMISAESHLCRRPEANFQKINGYLLQQNDELRGLTFSIKDRDIVLSMLIYDQFLNDETAKSLLQDLLDKSDEYDDILVKEWGCSW